VCVCTGGIDQSLSAGITSLPLLCQPCSYPPFPRQQNVGVQSSTQNSACAENTALMREPCNLICFKLIKNKKSLDVILSHVFLWSSRCYDFGIHGNCNNDWKIMSMFFVWYLSYYILKIKK